MLKTLATYLKKMHGALTVAEHSEGIDGSYHVIREYAMLMPGYTVRSAILNEADVDPEDIPRTARKFEFKEVTDRVAVKSFYEKIIKYHNDEKLKNTVRALLESMEQKDNFAKGVKALRGIDCPCSWQEFCELAEETLPGCVIIGDREHHPEAHYDFYSFSVYAYTDESQSELIGEDVLQAWLDLQPDSNNTITKIR